MTAQILGRQPRPPLAAVAAERRMLVTVTVLGSAELIHFIVSQREPVADVIGTTLRCYAREGLFPAPGCDVGEFHLFFFAQSGYIMEHPAEPIGARGVSNFTLCKKRLQHETIMVPRMAAGTGVVVTAAPQPDAAVEKKGGGGGVWKACLGKSLHLNIPTH